MNSTKNFINLLNIVTPLDNSPNQKMDLALPEINLAFNIFLKNLKSTDAQSLSAQTSDVISILNRLPLLQSVLLFNQINEDFPGTGFHYLIIAQANYHAEYDFFMSRIHKLKNSGILNEIFSHRMIGNIENITESYSKDELFQKAINKINSFSNIPAKELEDCTALLLKLKESEPQIPELTNREILKLLSQTLTHIYKTLEVSQQIV